MFTMDKKEEAGEETAPQLTLKTLRSFPMEVVGRSS